MATVTVSPGRMRMKFLRILPAIWATISCPFSRRTRNCVLARAATTLPCTWIASSLAIPSPHQLVAATKTEPALDGEDAHWPARGGRLSHEGPSSAQGRTQQDAATG